MLEKITNITLPIEMQAHIIACAKDEIDENYRADFTDEMEEIYMSHFVALRSFVFDERNYFDGAYYRGYINAYNYFDYITTEYGYDTDELNECTYDDGVMVRNSAYELLKIALPEDDSRDWNETVNKEIGYFRSFIMMNEDKFLEAMNSVPYIEMQARIMSVIFVFWLEAQENDIVIGHYWN